MNEKESHAWVENISAVFLEAVIVFENVVHIPSEDATCKQSEATRWTQRREYNKYGGVKYLFTKEDEILLISYIENILGEDLNLIDEEIQEILKIKDMMEGLYVAMAFASH